MSVFPRTKPMPANSGFFTSSRSSNCIKNMRKVSNPSPKSGFIDDKDMHETRRRNGITRQLYWKRIKNGMSPIDAATIPPKQPTYKRVNYWRFVTKYGDLQVNVFNIDGKYTAVAVFPTKEHIDWVQARFTSDSIEEALRQLQSYVSLMALVIEVVPPGQPTRKEIRRKTNKHVKAKENVVISNLKPKKGKPQRFGDDDNEIDLDDLDDIMGGEYEIQLYDDSEEDDE